MREKIEEKHRLLTSGEFDPAAYLDKLIEQGRIDFAGAASLIDYYIDNGEGRREAEPIASPVTEGARPAPLAAPTEGETSAPQDPVDLDALNSLARVRERKSHALEFSDFFFDPLAYLMGNRDLEASPLHLADHYIRFGFAEGRTAPTQFDIEDYLQRYPDLRQAGLIPLDHLLGHGLAEGRTIRPLTSPPPSSGGRRFQDLQKLVSDTDAGLAADRYGRLIARWWRDFQATALAAALANKGWVGGAPMPPELTYVGLQYETPAQTDPAFRYMTQFIHSAFYGDLQVCFDRGVSELLLLNRLAARKVAPQPKRPASEEGVSLITPFFRHLAFFEECAASVDLLRRLTIERMPALAFEWILVNDDPDISLETLHAAIPEALRPYVKFVQGGGLKTTGATNLGIEHASNGWLLFLDCDDIILPNAILALDHYSRNFGARYFASGMIDIDSDNRIMRYRRHLESALRSPAVGMNAGHLKYVHRSLFDQYGPLDSMFDGCQDYEFLLRILDHEDIILVPEYMYMYRWHFNTQSVSSIIVQEQKAVLAKKIYARGRQPRAPQGEAKVRRIAALIRTTGERLDSLKEAVMSCRSLQAGAAIEPVVIVHGDALRLACVQTELAGFDAHVLHATETKRSRGYPLNVGARFALETLGCDGFGILDDDDIYLPGMHQMACQVDGDAVVLHAGRVLCKAIDGGVTEPYKTMPAAQLTTSNFLPTNGFIVTRALAEAIQGLHDDIFPTDMFYLEDYVFLLRAWHAGGELSFFDAFVGEFRMGSDGNTHERKFPFEFQRCAAKARMIAQRAAKATKARRAASLDSLPQHLARAIGADEAAELIGTIY